MSLKLALATAVALGSVVGARGSEPGCPGSIQWDGGGGSTSWTNPVNWSGNVFPTAGDDVCVPDLASGVEVVHSSGTHAVHSLAGTGGLQVSGGTLSFGLSSPGLGQLALSGGTMSGTGDLPILGAFSWLGGAMTGSGSTQATDAAIGGATKDLSGDRVLETSGTTTWTGTIRMSTAGSIENNGTWDAQGNGALTDVGSAGAFFNPAGSTFRKPAGGGLTTIAVPFQNGGTVQVQSGTLSFEGASTTTGSIQGDASATVQFAGGAHVLAPGSSLSASTVIVNGGSLTVDGAYATTTSAFVDATVTLHPAATPPELGAVIVGGSALLDLPSGEAHANRLSLFAGTLSGAGNLTAGTAVWSGGTMSGSGTTAIRAGSLSGSAPKDLKGGRVLRFLAPNGNTVDWDGAGPIRLGSGASIENSADFDVRGGSIQDLGGAGGFRNQPGGAWHSFGGMSVVEVPFTNRGTVWVFSGTLQFTAGYTQLDGLTRLGDGATLSVPSPLDLQAGTLDGSGTVAASVVSSGKVYSPYSGGNLTIDGDYTQTAQGTLAARIKEVPPGSSRSRLVVTGTVSLTGTLEVTVIEPFYPQNGDTFTILTAPEIAGSFGGTNAPPVSGGLGWLVHVEPTQIVLEIAPDADGDGLADAGDCAPGNAGARSVPTEAAHLVFAGDKQTLSWDPQDATAGSGTVYDVVSGLVSELPVGGVGEICVRSGGVSPQQVDATVPGPGACFYYLVRARNVCGTATYGTQTGGIERTTATCP